MVSLWYPAAASDGPRAPYMTPAESRLQLPGRGITGVPPDALSTVRTNAVSDAAPAGDEGSLPLVVLSPGSTNPRNTLTGSIDPSRIAMAGHSAGGAAAVAAMLAGSRVRAGIDMDGATAARIPARGLSRPFLFLGKQSNYTPGGEGAVTTWERDWPSSTSTCAAGPKPCWTSRRRATQRSHSVFRRWTRPSANWRQVLHLLLGQVEPDPVLHLGHRAGRDGDFLFAPQMPFSEQHVGHPVVARIDLATMHPPDLTVEGMDGLIVLDVCLTQRNNVLGNGLHRS